MARVLPPVVVLTLLPFLAACGEEADTAVARTGLVRGAPIDGSADGSAQGTAQGTAEGTANGTAEGTASDDSPAHEPKAPAADPAPDDAAAMENDPAGSPDASAPATDAEPADATAEAKAAESKDLEPEPEDADGESVDEAQTADDAEPTENAPKLPEPDEEGVYHIEFSHLSLEGEDVDNLIDYLLFPEEFEEGEGFRFPEHIKALDGKEVTLEGYMIPGRIRQNQVRDFMLVRDLAGCCFGGAPNPDEWVDVVMEEGEEAEYLRYLPMTVRGTLELMGEQDQEGYAVGVYRMEASWAGEVD